MYRVFILESKAQTRKNLEQQVRKKYSVNTFTKSSQLLEAIEKDSPDLLILDIGSPQTIGLEILKKTRKLAPNTLVIMTSDEEKTEYAVQAMKLGAYDYLIKPIAPGRLDSVLKLAFASIQMHIELRRTQEKYIKENMPCFITESQSIQKVIVQLRKAAQSKASILILGQSGTGKELMAQYVHYNSPFFQGPFIALNCAAIPSNLLESELFGYEKGAFSGASVGGKKGQVELAANGTLFLDEVGDLSSEAQAKLLRFLESGEYYRIGGTEKQKVQTRIVTATNKDLEEMIDEGTFREDLYFRLTVFKLEIPSLKERQEDILPIAKAYLVSLGEVYKKKFQGFSPDLEDFLLAYEWKGNIRELKNLIERGIILSEGPTLTLEDVAFVPRKKRRMYTDIDWINTFPALPEKGIDLAALEEHFMKEAIQRSKGNDTNAAKLLRMPYYAFRYRKKKGFGPPEES